MQIFCTLVCKQHIPSFCPGSWALVCGCQCGSRLKEEDRLRNDGSRCDSMDGQRSHQSRVSLAFMSSHLRPQSSSKSSFFNWSSFPQMNGMPYRRRPSQSGWTSTWKRWEISTYFYFDVLLLFYSMFNFFYHLLTNVGGTIFPGNFR